MKLQALRDEPLPILIREAGWRAIRSMRKSIFPLQRQEPTASNVFVP